MLSASSDNPVWAVDGVPDASCSALLDAKSAKLVEAGSTWRYRSTKSGASSEMVLNSFSAAAFFSFSPTSNWLSTALRESSSIPGFSSSTASAAASKLASRLAMASSPNAPLSFSVLSSFAKF